jgi:hypothetical protein
MTTDPEALDRAIASATSVRAFAVGAFDPKRRDRSNPVLVVVDPLRLANLREALAVSPKSLESVTDVMTCGVLDLCFLVGHTLITTVTYLEGGPDMIRWSQWSGDVELKSPNSLSAWLADNG